MTQNPQSVVDVDELTVRRSIRIEAPPERVWAAVTEPEQISAWFGTTVLVGAGRGATGTITWPGRSPVPVRVDVFDAPRTVSYRWNNHDVDGQVPAELDVERSTVFTFTLEPVPGGTLLTVVETGFEATSAPLEDLESHRHGWDGELDKLVALLEDGPR